MSILPQISTSELLPCVPKKDIFKSTLHLDDMSVLLQLVSIIYWAEVSSGVLHLTLIHIGYCNTINSILKHYLAV